MLRSSVGEGDRPGGGREICGVVVVFDNHGNAMQRPHCCRVTYRTHGPFAARFLGDIQAGRSRRVQGRGIARVRRGDAPTACASSVQVRSPCAKSAWTSAFSAAITDALGSEVDIASPVADTTGAQPRLRAGHGGHCTVHGFMYSKNSMRCCSCTPAG